MTTANTDQHAAWNGESGQRWVASADRRDAVFAPIADLLLDAAAITVDERVLDIGCGCGASTLLAAAATGPAGAVVGADLSATMLDVALTRADGHANVEYRQVDVQTDPLGGPFDVAISRFGTMFFDDPTAAFGNIARHLSPGGRLCIATWQPLDANEWLVVPGAALLDFGTLPSGADPAAPGMFAQSDPSAVHDVLANAGFADIRTEPHTRALHVGRTIPDAVDYLADTGVGRTILETIPPERRDEALAAVSDALRPHHDTVDGVMLDAAVLLTTASTAQRSRS